MKRCNQCMIVKLAEDFHAHPLTRDRLAGICKECHQQRMRDRYHAKMQDPEWRAAEASRCRQKAKLYYHAFLKHDPDYWEKRKEISKQYGRKYPEKLKARRVLRNAIRSGKVTRPKHCSDCERKVRVEGHHPDYSKPLEVIWLCRICHMAGQHRKH